MQDALEDPPRKQNSMVGWLDAIDTLMQPVQERLIAQKNYLFYRRDNYAT